MNQPLVILTYPGHFLLTALTIHSFFRNNPLTPVTVVVDDVSDKAWPGYIDDCKSLYQFATVIPVSSFNIIMQYKDKIDDPWVRQQLVKLHLDQLLPFDTWFFTDGDIEYCSTAPINSIPYCITRGGPTQDSQNAYVAKTLGIDNPGVFAIHPDMDWGALGEKHQVCVSNPPFRTMWAQHLGQLREHVENLHKTSFIEMQLEIVTNSIKDSLGNLDYLMSEWELLANFQISVLGYNIPLKYFPTNKQIGPVERITLPADFVGQPADPVLKCGTCYRSDSSFPRMWWEYIGITVDDRVWNEIIKIVR